MLNRNTLSGNAFDPNRLKKNYVIIKTLSRHGRLSGAVIVLAKNTFSSFVKGVEEDVENTVVFNFRVNKDLFGTCKDIMFVSSYICGVFIRYSYWETTPSSVCTPGGAHPNSAWLNAQTCRK